jgi:murein DD-endopeptidase MepM/ murein hydrolase activator NlpD
MRIFVTLFIMLCPLWADALEISGPLTQGGWILGKVSPNQTVEVDATKVPVAEDGTFFYGLNRHTAPEVQVKVFENGAQVAQQALIINQRTYKTQHIKGVAPKTVNPDPKDMARIKADSAAINRARAELTRTTFFTQEFGWPISGTISGVYGSRRTYNGEERNWHKGLDIAAPTGTLIVAPAAAKVALALPESFFNGNLVILDHGHQVFTIYAHMDTLNVTTGQQVAAGEKLGTVGTTGRSTGPHLHWGLYWRNIALDPQLLRQGKTE